MKYLSMSGVLGLQVVLARSADLRTNSELQYDNSEL